MIVILICVLCGAGAQRLRIVLNVFSLGIDVPNGSQGSYVRTYLVWAGLY